MTDSLHPARLEPDKLLSQCEVRHVRRSGPGGQHRNKVETGVVLIHTPTGIAAEASERRSQAQNRRVALHRLRINLALAVRATISNDAPPSRLWVSRCRGGRIAVSEEHDDFPTLLAEALDALDGGQTEMKVAADRLACTTSQLVKLLKTEPRALALVNAARASTGLNRLK